MRVIRWFTTSAANTREPSHPDLHPADLALGVGTAVSSVASAVSRLDRWAVASADPVNGALHLTRRTRVLRLVDDIRLRFEPTPGGCRVHAESRGRRRAGDLGRNRRNILELWAAIRGLRA